MFKHNHKTGLWGFHSKYLELTSAQLLALNATPQTLVPAPGKGRGLVFDGALVQYLPGTIEYVSAAGAGAVTNRIVTSVNLTNTTLTIAAQPQAPSYITGTITDTTPSITAGLITILGKDVYGNTITEVIDVSKIAALTAASISFRTVQVFAYVTSVITSTFATLGGAGDETIIVGTEFASARDFGIYYGSLANSYNRVGILHNQGFLRMAAPSIVNSIVTVVNLTNISFTLTAGAAALPSPSAVLVTLVDTTPSITTGQIVITGTDQAGNTIGEAISLVASTLVYISTLAYASVTSVRAVGVATLGGSGDETIKVGTASGPKLAWIPPMYPVGLVPLDNVALVVGTELGELTAGNGTVKIRTFYRTMDLALRA
jgi:hypothetical protein